MDEAIKSACCLLSFISENFFVPGYIENWTLVVNTNSLGVFGFPYTSLKTVVSLAQMNFAGRLHKMFILNPSPTFNSLQKMATAMMHPETTKKIKVLKKGELSELLEEIPPEQLLKEFGGTLETPKSLWPVPNTLNEDSVPLNNTGEELSEPFVLNEQEQGKKSKLLRLLERVEGSETIEMASTSTLNESSFLLCDQSEPAAHQNVREMSMVSMNMINDIDQPMTPKNQSESIVSCPQILDPEEIIESTNMDRILERKRNLLEHAQTPKNMKKVQGFLAPKEKKPMAPNINVEISEVDQSPAEIEKEQGNSGEKESKAQKKLEMVLNVPGGLQIDQADPKDQFKSFQIDIPQKKEEKTPRRSYTPKSCFTPEKGEIATNFGYFGSFKTIDKEEDKKAKTPRKYRGCCGLFG